MSSVPIMGNMSRPNPDLPLKEYTSMGITAENVAEQYHITREMQDAFALRSHQKAAAARNAGKFAQEIIPVEAVSTHIGSDGFIACGRTPFATDEGIRPTITVEQLGKLNPPFMAGGTVTAGNSSQTSDGAAFVVIMDEARAIAMGIRPIAFLASFAVAGVPAEIMGIGPVKAIPKALRLADMFLTDIDLIELNKAFASQSLACINELGLDTGKVNVNGGAIAMGHPLGCTGALLTVKLLHELRRQKKRTGMVSMCIAGGIGAAGIFHMCD